VIEVVECRGGSLELEYDSRQLIPNSCNYLPLGMIREYLLSFGTESLVFQFAIQLHRNIILPVFCMGVNLGR